MAADMELATRIVNFLNQLHTADPRAIHALTETRVLCNEALASHPTCQAAETTDGPKVGLLGVLNGLCGVDARGWGVIAGQYGEQDELLGFVVLDPKGRDDKRHLLTAEQVGLVPPAS